MGFTTSLARSDHHPDADLVMFGDALPDANTPVEVEVLGGNKVLPLQVNDENPSLDSIPQAVDNPIGQEFEIPAERSKAYFPTRHRLQKLAQRRWHRAHKRNLSAAKKIDTALRRRFRRATMWFWKNPRFAFWIESELFLPARFPTHRSNFVDTFTDPNSWVDEWAK